MILLTPQRTLTGSYSFSARNNETPEVFLYDKTYKLYRLDEQLTPNEAGHLYNRAQLQFNTLSFHPSLERAAFVTEDDALGLGDFNGQLLWSTPGSFACALFSHDGERIWAAQKLDENRLQLFVYRAEDGALLHSLEMEDPLVDSALRFMDIPDSTSVTLELAAGQDGISVYELSVQDHGLEVNEMFPHSCYITPAWRPDGRSLFTMENDAYVYACFSYPGLALSAEQEQLEESEESEGPDLYPGYGMLYLSSGLAVTQNMNERFFLFDPVQMKRIDELAFAGYEPLPESVVYPNLDDEDSLCSQISSFERVGKLLIAKTGSMHEPPQLLLMEESALLEAIQARS